MNLRRPGVSVIEVIIALSLAAVVIAAVGNLVSATHRLTTSSAKEIQATAFAKQWSEVMSNQAKNFFSGSACSPRASAGFTTCWNLNPPSTGSCVSPNFYKQHMDNAGVWTLLCSNPATTSFPGDQDFYPALGFTRKMTIVTLPRNSDGSLNISGTTITTDCTTAGYSSSNDCNTKIATVTVAWAGGHVTLPIMLSAWKN